MLIRILFLSKILYKQFFFSEFQVIFSLHTVISGGGEGEETVNDKNDWEPFTGQ